MPTVSNGWLSARYLRRLFTTASRSYWISLGNAKQLREAPSVVGQSGFHRGSDPQRGVDSAEVVVREVQSDGCAKVLPFLRESIGQARQPSHLHTHGQVLAFNMGGADSFGNWVSGSWDYFHVHDFGRRVPLLTFTRIFVDLHELGEVDVHAERQFNGFGVASPSVRTQLEFSRSGTTKFVDEGNCFPAVPFAEVPCEDQFCVPLDGDESISIANGVSLSFQKGLGPFLHRHVAPHLVAFHVADGKVNERCIQQLFAMLASLHQESQDGVAIESGQPFGTADRASFQQALDCHQSGIGSACHGGAGQSGVRLGKRRATGKATPSLDAAFSVSSESLSVTVVTFGARHIGLEFLAGQADNEFASALRLTPRADMPRLSVSADGGALLSWWARQGLNLQPTDSKSVALGQFELRAHLGGIQGLAPKNALCSFAEKWWRSDFHSSFPFAWIELLKSFLEQLPFLRFVPRFIDNFGRNFHYQLPYLFGVGNSVRHPYPKLLLVFFKKFVGQVSDSRYEQVGSVGLAKINFRRRGLFHAPQDCVNGRERVGVFREIKSTLLSSRLYVCGRETFVSCSGNKKYSFHCLGDVGRMFEHIKKQQLVAAFRIGEKVCRGPNKLSQIIYALVDGLRNLFVSAKVGPVFSDLFPISVVR